MQKKPKCTFFLSEEVKNNIILIHCLSRPVIPNQGAAAHRGALRRCQGCRQMFNLLSYLVFYRLGCYKLSFFAG